MLSKVRSISILLFLTYLHAAAQGSFREAEVMFLNGEQAKAQPIFENYLKSNPSHEKTLEYLGDIAALNSNWNTSLKYFRKLVEVNPRKADHHYKFGGALGMVAKNSNKFKALTMIGEIRDSFEKAIDIAPKHIGARWALIELNLELPAIAGGSQKDAKEYADQLGKISPVDGWLAKGHIAERTKKYQHAEAYYKKAIAVGGSKTTYQKLADLYQKKLNQPAKAKAVLAEFNSKNKH